MNIPRPSNVPQRHYQSWDRLSEYVQRKSFRIEQELGWGAEGLVYSTSSKTAAKAFLHRILYENERNVYLRLRDLNISSVDEFAIPRLVDFSDDLWIVEMTIVSPPFILDFAGAYLDKRPQYDDDVLEEWEREKIEQFGDRWPVVTGALATFRRHKIYLADVKPGNVTFPAD